MNRTITIASGKGGVGKTTLAGNLAKVIAESGVSVLLIDGDLERGGLDLTLGLESTGVFDLLDVAEGVAELDKAVTKISPRLDLFFLSVSSGGLRGRSLQGAHLHLILDALKNKFQYVFIDCAASNMETFRLFAAQSTDVIVVATPERTSIREAERVASEVRHCLPWLVVNRIRAKQIGQGSAPDIDTMIDSVGGRLLGLIPEDDTVSMYQNSGILIADAPCKAALHLRDTAKRLMGQNIRLRKV